LFWLSDSRLWSCSDSRLWSWKLFQKPALKICIVHRRNWPMREKESRNRNLMRLSEQSLELVSVFREGIQKPKLHLHVYRNYWFNSRGLQKISNWWPNPFKNPPVPVNNIYGSACEEGRWMVLCWLPLDHCTANTSPSSHPSHGCYSIGGEWV